MSHTEGSVGVAVGSSSLEPTAIPDALLFLWVIMVVVIAIQYGGGA